MSTIGYEANCRKCGETFNPNWMDANGNLILPIEHYVRDDGTECGGIGELTGSWGRGPLTMNDPGHPLYGVVLDEIDTHTPSKKGQK